MISLASWICDEIMRTSCFQGKAGSPGERGPPGKLVSDLWRCHSAEFLFQWFQVVRRLGANLAHRLVLLFCRVCVFIAGVYDLLNAKLGNKKCFTCKFNRCWSHFSGSSRQELALLCPVMYCCSNRFADTCRCAGNYHPPVLLLIRRSKCAWRHLISSIVVVVCGWNFVKVDRFLCMIVRDWILPQLLRYLQMLLAVRGHCCCHSAILCPDPWRQMRRYNMRSSWNPVKSFHECFLFNALMMFQ